MLDFQIYLHNVSAAIVDTENDKVSGISCYKYDLSESANTTDAENDKSAGSNRYVRGAMQKATKAQIKQSYCRTTVKIDLIGFTKISMKTMDYAADRACFELDRLDKG